MVPTGTRVSMAVKSSRPHFIRTFFIILLAMSALYAVRMATPDDLSDRDQVRQCAYILDAAYNAHWLCQVDSTGDITSKPPLYSWIGALMVLLFGPNRFSFSLPAFFGILLAAVVVWQWAWDLEKDERTAWFALLCYLVSSSAIKQLALVRTDGIFSGLVALCAWKVWRAWETGEGWWVTWLYATLAVLAKGPFALVLGFGGLISLFFQGKDIPQKKLPPHWWNGAILPIAIGGVWSFFSMLTMGSAFYQKLFVRELWGQFMGSTGKFVGIKRLTSAIKVPLYLISRALPWSLLFFWNPGRNLFKTFGGRETERGKRYIIAFIIVGLFFLMTASHKRGDLVFPLLPAMAILEGHILSRLSLKMGSRKPILTAILILFTALILLGYVIMELTFIRPRHKIVALGLANKAYTEKIERTMGRFPPLSFRKAPNLEFRLGVTMRNLTHRQVVDLLSANEKVLILTQHVSELLSSLPRGLKTYRMMEDPKLSYAIISNKPGLFPDKCMVVATGEWELKSHGAFIRRVRGSTAWIDPDPGGSIYLKNLKSRGISIRLILPKASSRILNVPSRSTVSVSFP